jgi:predicted glutamine amidotransferase
MCELFAMSSENPAKLRYELADFATHGGQRYCNRDGWGIVFAQARDAYLFKEPGAGSTSALQHMVATDPPLSKMVLAHVRRATSGNAALWNTHPFRRTILGQARNFAHNGDLPELKEQYAGSAQIRECIGDTDSELAFMVLQSRLAGLNDTATLADRFDVFAGFAHDMRQLGDSNFLYSEGEALFVHADQRQYEDGYGQLSEPRTPGLHICEIPRDQRSWQVKGASFETEDAGSQLLIASVPLEAGQWTGLPRGTALLLQHGSEIMREAC